MVYEPLKPFAAYSGAKRPKMLLLGEAWGSDEAAQRAPFVGASGKLLFEMLGEAMPEVEPELYAHLLDLHRYGLAWVRERDKWFEAAQIGMTNVLNFQPPGNKIEPLCLSKKEVGSSYDLPAITKGKYLDPQFLPELDRLIEEVDLLRPNLVVALGNTASWALLRATNIGSIRGAVTRSNWAGNPVKTLPTFHPAGVLYQWSWRTIVVADLMKAAREAKFSEIRRPQRRVLIDPSIQDVETYCKWLELRADASPIPLEVGGDIETAIGQIKMISFAPSKSEAIVIPFIDEKKPGRSYWPTYELEFRAWKAVRSICEHKNITLVGQNFIYDMQYICPLGIKIARTPEDTMMLHHSIYPEMKKSLGFLGSIYTDESSWKLMRNQKADTEKRDE